ncbi:hypothetical protein GH741_08410 [Aquibacillus halophilus]|uniref:PhoP regulatory network protein YrbL n=1 Tax=Aquibacillus halophilus TaxID=930132 RepID=A0A6A8DAS4_9BACI|nr:hypothetical protein [Aquibacillus halophilus]MRH42708.1 hypothetical protein [Aquibacillus halophilus]
MKVKGYRLLTFDKKITNGIFKVFVDKKSNLVIKVNRRDSSSSSKFYKKIKGTKEFDIYKKTLMSAVNKEFLKPHICSVTEVFRDGGYKSPFVQGKNIQVMLIEFQEGHLMISKEESEKLLTAIDNLYLNLKQYYQAHENLPGDWMLHNLVYDNVSNKIINVDIEGFYTFKGFLPDRINKQYLNNLKYLIKKHTEHEG